MKWWLGAENKWDNLFCFYIEEHLDTIFKACYLRWLEIYLVTINKLVGESKLINQRFPSKLISVKF
jgi:hypothetical protein